MVLQGVGAFPRHLLDAQRRSPGPSFRGDEPHRGGAGEAAQVQAVADRALLQCRRKSRERGLAGTGRFVCFMFLLLFNSFMSKTCSFYVGLTFWCDVFPPILM
jgi:hypothetical protein